MTALALRRGQAGAWPAALIALAGTWSALLLLFRSDVAAVAGLWWTSTTYGHCLFILPVVAWLVWTRRRALARLTSAGWAPGVLLVAAGAFAWLLGDAGEVALVRQWALVAMLEGAVAATLGPNVVRGLLFPLAYAWFAVPFGAELEPPLQQVTVAMVMPLLHVAGVPASVDGVLIHAGRYYFEVAEACSGAKFVLAMLAYGVLVAHLCFRSWRRRAIFMAAALVVPVIANGIRAFATIYAAHLTSVEAATGLDHIVYGWVFFAVVMAALMAAAWRWFDRAPDAEAFDPARLRTAPRWTLAPLAAGVLAVTAAAIAPAWSGAIAARARPLPHAIALPVVAGWQRVAVATRGAWAPWHPGADHHLFGRYTDARGDAVDMALAAFAGQGEGRKLAAFGTGPLREADRWIRVADLPAIDGGRAMRIVAQEKDGTTVERVVVTWYRVGDTLTGDDAAVKFATMKDRLAGGTQTAVALYLSAPVAPGRDAVAAIRRFRAALGPPDRAIDGIVAQGY
ncbi:MAG: exosortase A [Sphingomonas adhaesiva]|uniref:exosortase A n=1 Tax=Sphingomonas adhaesiva TaxID=28212 RepID=UPI002FF4B83C